jgi:hypothetical protein
MSPAVRIAGVMELLRLIKAHNQHTETLLRASGERFNGFDILRIDHPEVETHSPILADLLNTRGSRRQGSICLRLSSSILSDAHVLKDAHEGTRFPRTDRNELPK